MPDAGSIAPALLVAMPQLLDRNFHRSVVLLVEHNEERAVGFVVNKPTETRAAEAVVLDPPANGDSGLCLWTGGPVEPHRGFLLLGRDPGTDADESEEVTTGFHLTASLDVLRRLIESSPASLADERCRLLLGYAGWGPGQLDHELAQSAWLLAPISTELVFETHPDAMWERAIRSLGIDPLALQAAPGIQ